MPIQIMIWSLSMTSNDTNYNECNAERLTVFFVFFRNHSGDFIMINPNRLGSRFCVNETSQFSERNSAQMQAVMKQKR